MDASTEFEYVDLEAQEAPKQKPKIDLENVDTMDPLQFASLLAGKAPLKIAAEDLEDAIEIELDAGEMDALLGGKWQP